MNSIQPDSDDISRFKAGDKTAFEKIYKYYYASLYCFAVGIVKKEEDAQDIVSEAFVKLWNQRDKFKEGANIKSLLWVITRNACFDYLRAIKRHTASHKEILHLSREEERLASPESFGLAMIEQQVIVEIQSEITTLSPKCRAVIELIYYHRKKIMEVADLLGITPGTVRHHKNSAIKRLRDVLLKNNLLSSE